MSELTAPRPTAKMTIHNEHGIPREDPYYWLKNKETDAVIEHLKAENEYCESLQGHHADLRKELYTEMLGRIQETDASSPTRRGDYWYYSRTEEGLSYPIYCRKKGSVDAEEEVYLDQNVLAKDHEYFHMNGLTVSPDHHFVAWLADTDGGERFVLHVKDLRTGTVLDSKIHDLKWSLAWAADSRTLFYCKSDAAQRPYKIFRWHIERPTTDELEVLHEPNERFFLHVGATRDHQWVLLGCHSKQTSTVHVVDANEPETPPQLVRPRKDNVEYHVGHRKGEFYILHNDGAQNFMIVKRAVAASSDTEVVVVPHQKEVYLTDIDLFDQHLVVSERFNGLPRRCVIDLRSMDQHHIDMPEEVYDVGEAWNPVANTTTFRFTYTSPTTPRSVLQYDMETTVRKVLKVQPVLGGFNADDYAAKRVWATAPDGTCVPMSMVHRKDLALNSETPTYLRAYGSYGMPYPVTFQSNLLSLLDRGVLVVVAHIRGGSEMGRDWYENGKFFNKKNTFTDFIACAETLIEDGYTSASRLVISGGSAGGLLMGAVLNARPDLFRAALALVPFVDVATTMSDPSLPLTVTEYEEWGDPNKKDVFEYILSYSPYDQVKHQDYPTLFVTAGLNDPRVSYWEPAKWVARLRDRKTNDTPVLFRIHMGAGHGGASGRYGYLDDVSWQYAFILGELDLSDSA